MSNQVHTGWLDSRIARKVPAAQPAWHLAVIAGAVVRAHQAVSAHSSEYLALLAKGQLPHGNVSLVHFSESLIIGEGASSNDGSASLFLLPFLPALAGTGHLPRPVLSARARARFAASNVGICCHCPKLGVLGRVLRALSRVGASPQAAASTRWTCCGAGPRPSACCSTAPRPR